MRLAFRVLTVALDLAKAPLVLALIGIPWLVLIGIQRLRGVKNDNSTFWEILFAGNRVYRIIVGESK